MACRLMAPNNCLNQRGLIISEVLCHIHKGNFSENTEGIYPRYEIRNYLFKNTTASSKGHKRSNIQYEFTGSL